MQNIRLPRASYGVGSMWRLSQFLGCCKKILSNRSLLEYLLEMKDAIDNFLSNVKFFKEANYTNNYKEVFNCRYLLSETLW